MRDSVLDKILIVATALALAGLVYCFTVINSDPMKAVTGDQAAPVKIILGALFIYFAFAALRSFLLVRRYQVNRVFATVAVMASLAGLVTLAGDLIFLRDLAGLYEEGYGYASQQQMLLISLLVKFLSLVVIAVSLVKTEEAD